MCFHIFILLSIQNAVFWVMISYSLLYECQHLREVCYLYLHGLSETDPEDGAACSSEFFWDMMLSLGLEAKILDMKLPNSLETLITQMMQHNIPEELNPQPHNCKNLKTQAASYF